MRIMMRDSRVFQGTPLQIVRAMQHIAFSERDFSFSEYVDWVIENVRRFDEVELNVQGTADEERAESLVAEMIRTGLAKRAGRGSEPR